MEITVRDQMNLSHLHLKKCHSKLKVNDSQCKFNANCLNAPDLYYYFF